MDYFRDHWVVLSDGDYIFRDLFGWQVGEVVMDLERSSCLQFEATIWSGSVLLKTWSSKYNWTLSCPRDLSKKNYTLPYW